MQAIRSKPMSIEVKARGQVTIPKKLREKYHLSEGSEMTIFPVGEALVLAHRPLPLEEARKKLIRILFDSGVGLKELLSGLDVERDKIASKRYGRQK